jgi:hypothetical protein
MVGVDVKALWMKMSPGVHGVGWLGSEQFPAVCVPVKPQPDEGEQLGGAVGLPLLSVGHVAPVPHSVTLLCSSQTPIFVSPTFAYRVPPKYTILSLP